MYFCITDSLSQIIMNMNKKNFDRIVIILIAVVLVALAYFGLLEKSAKFMLVPLLAVYYIGQYSERSFK